MNTFRSFFLGVCVALLLVLTTTCAFAELTSRSAILMNMSTGRILYKHNPYELIPPASLTKVLSMYVTLDLIKAQQLQLDNTVSISKEAAATGGSKMILRKGEKVSIDKLLMGMAVSSGNNASLAIAQHITKKSATFINMMNKKAAELGMRNSTFYTPHGLPAEGQYTTAVDMLKMARSYLKAHPAAMRYHNTQEFTHNGKKHENTNKLLGKIHGLNGLKTGWTIASGHNLIFTAERDGVQLLGVILGGTSRINRDVDAKKLLEAGFASPDSAASVNISIDGEDFNARLHE